jgi:hypothetical protein
LGFVLAAGGRDGVRAQTDAPPRTAAQLEQLVAPIALYPDALVSQILMASTYPLEVVAAARWVQANPRVSRKALEDAMQKQSWDPSVKALTAVPQTLQMMNDKLDWTRDLGDAFLAQQADVLQAVQRLRQRADDAGNLKTTEQQKVIKTARAEAAPPSAGTPSAPTERAPQSSVAPADIYTIESVNPDEYYVPVYDPGVVYGAWPYPDYAPFYWYPPGWVGGRVFAFGAGVAVGAAIWGGIDWRRNRVDINVNRYNSFNRTNIANRNWTHNPAHRGAVPYRDRNVAQQFGKPGHAAAREGYRGTAEAGRREIARQGAGNRGHDGGPSKLGAAAAGAAAGAAVQRAAANRTGAGKQARSTPAAEHRQASRPKQTARPSQGAGNRQVAQHREQATRRQASAPRQQAARQQASTPRPAPRRQASAPRPAPRASAPSRGHVSRSVGGARAMARGGGRRSDIRLKHDITLLGRLDDGLGFYRFIYDGEEKAYVGVMAQEVRMVMPEAVVRGRDGYFRVLYDKLGLQFQSYQQWLASGARIPVHVAP